MMEVLTGSLERLIYPVKPEQFLREYWEQKPLRVQRTNRAYYDDIFSIAAADRFLNSTELTEESIYLVKGGEPVPLDGSGNAGEGPRNAFDVERLFAAYRGGATVVMRSLHRRWRPLMELTDALGEEFSMRFQVNAYLTPPGEQGLTTHYDTHDVFVVQLAGSKHWKLYGTPLPLPLRSQPFQSDLMETGPLLEEFDLNAGECLYVPRGCVHNVAGRGNGASLHLTVGVHAVTWNELLLDALQQVFEGDRRFRESLPVGFARTDSGAAASRERFRELLEVLVRSVDPEAALNQAVAKTRSTRRPLLNGHLVDLERSGDITPDTLLRRRTTVTPEISVDNDRVELRFHGKLLSLPRYVEPVLRFIAEEKSIKGRHLPDGLDEAGYLVLLRRLVREGFLTVDVSEPVAVPAGVGL